METKIRLVTVPATTLDDLIQAALAAEAQMQPHEPIAQIIRGCVAELRAGSRTAPRFERVPHLTVESV